jgi:hypothetical protein
MVTPDEVGSNRRVVPVLLQTAARTPNSQFSQLALTDQPLGGAFPFEALPVMGARRRTLTDTKVPREHFPGYVPGARMPEMREGERRWR